MTFIVDKFKDYGIQNGFNILSIKINPVDNSGYLLTIKLSILCIISDLSTNMSTKPLFLQAAEPLILSTNLQNHAQNPGKARVTSRIEQMVDWAGFEPATSRSFGGYTVIASAHTLAKRALLPLNYQPSLSAFP